MKTIFFLFLSYISLLFNSYHRLQNSGNSFNRLQVLESAGFTLIGMIFLSLLIIGIYSLIKRKSYGWLSWSKLIFGMCVFTVLLDFVIV